MRVALGAQSRDILVMVLKRGLPLAVAGIVPGVLLAYAAGRSMEALLAGVQPADALTLASVVGLLLVMAVLGGLAPTLRAPRRSGDRAARRVTESLHGDRAGASIFHAHDPGNNPLTV